MADPALLPPTVPEVRRLLWRPICSEPRPAGDIVAWSRWRRRPQARARHYHWRRRTHNQIEVRL